VPAGWLDTLLLWSVGHLPGRASATVSHAIAAVDVVCHYQRQGPLPGSALLASAITAMRLQVALPAQVPMMLCLVPHHEHRELSDSPPGCAPDHRPPLLVELAADGQLLTSVWEVWSKRGRSPRWVALPAELQPSLQVAWLEGRPEVAFEMPQEEDDGDTENEGLIPGKYELVFGDSQANHSVRRSGAVLWQARARREVR